MSRVFAAELTWTGERFERDVCLAVDAAGRITAVGQEVGTVTDKLHRTALLPGFVNVHSHAFQRGLRGRGETFPAGAGSFWTWREAMYELVTTLGPDAFEAVCFQAFCEMRMAGITTVGEFHYLHHADPDALDFELDFRVLQAAKAARIRLVLLQSWYAHGGPGRPLAGGQRHFRTASMDAFWAQMDRLEKALDPATQSLGIAPHSIRAATPGEFAELHAEARRRGMVVHFHAEEQPIEIDECLAAYGKRPLALLLDQLPIGPESTAVHATHTTPADLARFAATGATVCLCPTTEGNLGDGISNLPDFLAASGQVAFGSDSNARISTLDEMRWCELVQRLARQKRGVVLDTDGDVAPRLLDFATRGGARSLGIPTGRLEPGHWADFVLVDLDALELTGVPENHLADALVFGCGERVIAGTVVGGRT